MSISDILSVHDLLFLIYVALMSIFGAILWGKK